MGSIGDEEELGSSDCVGSAEEADFHTRILPSNRLGCAPGLAAGASRIQHAWYAYMPDTERHASEPHSAERFASLLRL
jgi:hypothetical protein